MRQLLLCAVSIASACSAQANLPAPSGLVAVPSISSDVKLSWAASASASGYYVVRDGVNIAAVSSPAYEDPSVQAFTTYSYSVVAFAQNRANSAPSAQVSVSTPPEGYSLVFDDEFTGQKLDVSKWTATWPWGSLNDTYPNDEALPQNIIVSDGAAHFTVTQTATPSGNAYGTAVATTAGKFSQQYGYWEARVKMPAKAHGLWPAFWLVATDGTWPPEIDIMEWLGNAPTADDMTVHYGSTNQTDEGIFTGPDFSADYHVLGLLWTSSGLHWYVDGVERFATTKGLPTKPMQIILNNSTGGWNGNRVDSSTVFPSSFDVDYVRVFENKGGVETPPAGDTAAPSTPSHLLAQARSGGQVNLSWNPSTDNVGVTGYQVFRGGVKIASVPTNSYQDRRLSRSTRYVYRVAAVDAAGNTSDQSSAVSVTTLSR